MNSVPAPAARPLHGPSVLARFAVVIVLALASLPGPRAADADSDPLALRARRAFEAAESRLANAPTSSVAGWEFARACFDWAEYATNSTQRAQLAERGIAVSRGLIAQEPNSPPGNYYLAMNLGQLARTKLLGALKLVSEMEQLFQRAAALDPKFDFAGPDRCLGLLYRDAPGWPTSVGSRKKARLHLERAVALCPDHPENRLVLLESWLKWGHDKDARAAIEEVAAVLRAARGRLAGERWQADWVDWDRRWTNVLRALNVTPASRVTRTAP